MTSLSEIANSIVKVPVQFLNIPIVKNSVKNISGTVSFVFGVMEIYNISQIQKPKNRSKKKTNQWLLVANKVTTSCAKLSLILSAGVSKPGVFIISSLTGAIFSTSQLERAFGQNTIFAVNPWHPRHVVSIVAVILAAPSVVKTCCLSVQWIYKKVSDYAAYKKPKKAKKNPEDDMSLRLKTLFNTITSRPFLHIGNQIGRNILAAGKVAPV